MVSYMILIILDFYSHMAAAVLEWVKLGLAGTARAASAAPSLNCLLTTQGKHQEREDKLKLDANDKN